MPELEFCWRRLEAMTAPEWHALIRAREAVFVVEQRCAYQEADEFDPQAWHLSVRCGSELAAYARVIEPGVKHAEAAIGRVLTPAKFRGLGVGRALVAEAIAFIERTFPGQGIRIGAQAHLEAFYRGFGFLPASDVYDDEGLPHLDMIRPAAPGTGC